MNLSRYHFFLLLINLFLFNFMACGGKDEIIVGHAANGLAMEAKADENSDDIISAPIVESELILQDTNPNLSNALLNIKLLDSGESGIIESIKTVSIKFKKGEGESGSTSANFIKEKNAITLSSEVEVGIYSEITVRIFDISEKEISSNSITNFEVKAGVTNTLEITLSINNVSKPTTYQAPAANAQPSGTNELPSAKIDTTIKLQKTTIEADTSKISIIKDPAFFIIDFPTGALKVLENTIDVCAVMELEYYFQKFDVTLFYQVFSSEGVFLWGVNKLIEIPQSCVQKITIPKENCATVKSSSKFTLIFRGTDNLGGKSELSIDFNPKDFGDITCPQL